MQVKKFIPLITIAITTFLITGCWETSKGEKIGTIVKIAKEGAFWPTWQSELIRGGFNSGTGANGKPFHFNIEKNDSEIKDIKKLMENGTPITIKYHCELWVAPWRGADNCSLDSIVITK